MYRKKSDKVNAFQIPVDFPKKFPLALPPHPGCKLVANPGDWIVYTKEDILVLTNEEFQTQYEVEQSFDWTKLIPSGPNPYNPNPYPYDGNPIWIAPPYFPSSGVMYCAKDTGGAPLGDSENGKITS